MKELSDLVKEGYTTTEAKTIYDNIHHEVYAENKHMLRFAKYTDKWARSLAPASASIDAVTIGGLLGVLPSMGMDFIKKMPKLGYITYYGAKTRDVVGTLGNLMYEAASLVPFAGEILDFKQRYADKAQKYVKKQVKKRVQDFIQGNTQQKAA